MEMLVLLIVAMKRKDVSSLPLIATTIILAPSTNVTK